VLDSAGDTVRAEDGDPARRDLVQLVDEMRSLGAQALDHMPIMHDLMAHVDGRPELLERPLDDLDRPLDPGAEAPRLGQHNPHSPIASRIGPVRGRPSCPNYSRNFLSCHRRACARAVAVSSWQHWYE